MIAFTLEAVFRNKESRRGTKVRGWRLWTFKLLDEGRKAVRLVIIERTYAGLEEVFRQLENTFSSTGQREEVNSRCCYVNKSNLGEKRVGMFHHGFLEAVLCRFKWIIEIDILKWQETVWAIASVFQIVRFKCKRGLRKQSWWQSFVLEQGSLRLLRDPSELPASLLISTNKGLSLVEGMSFHITVRAQGCGKGHLCLIGRHIRSIVRRSLQPSWHIWKLRK